MYPYVGMPLVQIDGSASELLSRIQHHKFTTLLQVAKEEFRTTTWQRNWLEDKMMDLHLSFFCVVKAVSAVYVVADACVITTATNAGRLIMIGHKEQS